MQAFHLTTDAAWKDLGEGVWRQVVSHTENVMLVKVKFNKGSVGALHQHPHVQMSYVESGVFDYMIDGKTQRLKKGESCLIASDLVHGCVCIEEGILLDVFSPYRKDFVE